MPELIVRKWDLPLSFEIFKEYGLYKARRGDTGEVQFSDPKADVVIQQAIDKIYEAGGGLLHIKAGLYYIASTIQVKRRVWVFGEGLSTRLIPTSDIDLFEIPAGAWDVGIFNLVLDDEDEVTTSHAGIFVNNKGASIPYLSISHVWIDSFYYGVRMPVDADHYAAATIYKLIIRNVRSHGFIAKRLTGSLLDHVRVTYGGSTSVAPNSFGFYFYETPGGYGTVLRHCQVNGSDRENTNGCMLDEGAAQLWFEACGFHRCHGNNLVLKKDNFECFFVDCWINDTVLDQSVVIGAHAGTAHGGVKRIYFVNCVLSTANKNGVWIEGVDANHNSDLYFVNCLIRNNGQDGVRIVNHYNERFTFISNQISDNGEANSGLGLRGSGHVVLGNHLYNQNYGVWMAAGTTDCIIACNDVRNNTTAGVLPAGTGHVIKHNVGYVTENSGTATGTGAQQSIAHGCDFTPTKAQVILSNIDDGANPYLSADPDATYIYVTAASGKDYRWEVKMTP